MKNESPEQTYMRPAEICWHFRVSRATLYRWAKNRHDFPKPIKAGDRVTLFEVAEVDKFIRAQT